MESETPSVAVRCRQVEPTDIDAVAARLTLGFPERGIDYWRKALATLEARKTPDGYPRFGYLLAVGQDVVGALLLIFSRTPHGSMRCNVSSWCVDPLYSPYASALVSAALRFKDVTYLNISPAPHTWPILEAQGYRRYNLGQFIGLPAFSLNGLRTTVEPYDPAKHDKLLPEPETALLRDHAACNCLSLMCQTGDRIAPLVFAYRPVKGLKTLAAFLAYCRETADFTSNMGAVGRFLLRHGVVLVFCDSDSPIREGLGAFFKDRAPRYYRGIDRPRLNDLAYTEAVLFGA
jgi:hypothetical protein